MEKFNNTTIVASNYSSTTPTTNLTSLSTEFSTSQYYNGTTQNITQSLLTESTTVPFSYNTTTAKVWNLTTPKVWNLTTAKVKQFLPNAVTTSSGSLCTTSTSTTTTEDPMDEFGPPEGLEYIFVPLGVMIFVIVLSAVVIIISRKRKLERLRHRLMPLYNFDPGEEGEDDWETELLDEGFPSRQRRQGYQSMDSEESAELFSTAHD